MSHNYFITRVMPHFNQTARYRTVQYRKQFLPFPMYHTTFLDPCGTKGWC